MAGCFGIGSSDNPFTPYIPICFLIKIRTLLHARKDFPHHKFLFFRQANVKDEKQVMMCLARAEKIILFLFEIRIGENHE